MAIKVGDLLFKLGIDKGELDRGLTEAKAQVENTGNQIKSSLEKWKGELRAAGAAFTAVGAAGLKMASDARQLNAQLGQTGLTLGVSTQEMRNLALATTNVTFPLQSVANTFELLSRAGVRNVEDMQASALAFDTLAAATGSSAEAVADILIPAFKAMGEEIPKNSKSLDKFTWLTKNTTIDLSDFGSVMQYVAMYGSGLGITLDDMTGIMAALEARGISGSAATRLFRTAVSQAKDGSVTLNAALGVTQEQIDEYSDKVAAATGITEKYAKEGDKQYGILDKLKQEFSKVSLAVGSLITPLEPVLATMTALGPVMLFLSSGIGATTAKWVAQKALMLVMHPLMTAQTVVTKAVTAAQWLWNAALSANPIGIVIVAIGALTAAGITLWKNWDKVKNFFIEAWDVIKIAFGHAVKFIVNTILLPFIEVFSKEFGGLLSIVGKAVGFFNKDLGNAISGVADKLLNARGEITAWADSLIDSASASQKARQSHKELEAQIEEFNSRVHALAEELTGKIKRELEKRRDDELAAIQKRKDDAKKDYDTAVEGINKKYGKLEDYDKDYTRSLMEVATERARITKEGYDKEIDAAKEKYNETIRLLDAEMAAKLAAYDDDIRDQVNAIRKQIDAIDEQTRLEDLALTRAREQQKLADLQAAIEAAETEEAKAEATQKYTEYETEVKRNELLRQRSDQKDALRKQIDQIQEAAKTGRDALESELKTEYDKRKEAAQKLFDEVTLPALMDSINRRKEEVDKALKVELADLEQQRKDALEIEGLKYTNPEGTGIFDLLDKEKDERVAYYKEQLTDANIQIAAINEAYSQLRTQYDITITTHHVDEYSDSSPPLAGESGLESVGLQSLPGWASGGIIREPTLLTRISDMRPYAIAGEAGPERVGPVGASVLITGNTFNVRSDSDIERIGDAIVAKIRMKTGVRI